MFGASPCDAEKEETMRAVIFVTLYVSGLLLLIGSISASSQVGEGTAVGGGTPQLGKMLIR